MVSATKGIQSFEYDAMGRLMGVAGNTGGDYLKLIQRNALGQPTNIGYVAGDALQARAITYDVLGRVSTLDDNQGNAVKFEYSHQGNVQDYEVLSGDPTHLMVPNPNA